ncbi:MAG: hypothetical protein AB7F43_07645 [Bacteriovoracia bacterium]
MKKSLFTTVLFMIFFTGVLSMASNQTLRPIPVFPVLKNIVVRSSGPKKEVWNRLSTNDKKLAYHLLEASRIGRDLLFNQSHRHGIAIKEILVDAFSPKHIQETEKLLGGGDSFAEFMAYGAKFMDMSGPYESSNRKYLVTIATPEQVGKVVEKYGKKLSPQTRTEIVKLITDPSYEVAQKPEDDQGTGLEECGGNIYEKGITGAEVLSAIKEKGLEIELNCRIIKKEDGSLTCERQTVHTQGAVGNILTAVVKELKAALPYAKKSGRENFQHKQIENLIKYFESGDIEDFRQMNVAWVKDGTKSVVDFMMGYVEVYEDWQGKVGTWESYVQIIDPEMTKVSKKIAENAQYFEEILPFGKWKKVFPKDYSPPAALVYYLQEISSYRTAGYNLPNFDDIRTEVGAKNIIRLPLPGEKDDPVIKEITRESYEEWAPTSKVDRLTNTYLDVRRGLVLGHEIKGHGSGEYDRKKYGEKKDPISELGALGSALEEQRADLAAIVILQDPKAIEIGLYKDAEDQKQSLETLFDGYLVEFVSRFSKQHSLSEAHQRGHWLFMNWLFDRKAIEWVAKDEKSKPTPDNQVLVVKDQLAFKKAAADLLAELQKIKATRDEAELKKQFDEKAPLSEADSEWAHAVIKRGQHLRANAGYVEQPWNVRADLTLRTYGDTTVRGVAMHWGI